jgi:hypothetical protein
MATSIASGAVAGATLSWVADLNGAAGSLFLKHSASGLSNNYVARLDSDGSLHLLGTGGLALNGGSLTGVVALSISGAMTATQFNGSGAGLTSGTVPNAALVTAPVTSVGASGNLSSSGGTAPSITMTATPSFTTLTLAGALTGATTGGFSGAVTASQFNGSGAGLSAGTVPNAALVTAPVTSVSASGNLASSGGTAPAISITANPSFTTLTLAGALSGATTGSFSGAVSMAALTATSGSFSSSITATNFTKSSLRALKTDIAPLSMDALDALKRTDLVTYRYKNGAEQHLGFLADEVPTELSPTHQDFDLAHVLTVALQAIKQLTSKVERLERHAGY